MASKDLTIRLIGDLTDLQKKLNQASNDLSKVGATMSKKVTPAAAATAVALTKLGNDWNNAVDQIIIGTGASGAALDGLLGSAKKVAGQVPNDFGQVGTAIAEVNTRLGLTGPELEATTKKFLDLSRITGTDVKTNIGLVTRVFGDWSVASKDQAGAMDTLFAATQQTGIGIDRLSSLVVQFGAPMRQLGFSMEESIAIFGKFEKEGVNIEAVMSGLRMGLGRMAKAGEEPIDTFKRLVDEIKNAGTQGEANALALEGFGQRAGPDMAAAIREGRFEIEDLVASLGNSEGALDDAASRTLHLSDRLKMLQNRITGALGPFGELGGAAAGAVAAMGPLLFALGSMGPALNKVAGAFGTLKRTMVGHPLLTIGVVLGAAAVAFGVFGDSVDDSTTSVDNLAQAMRDAETPLAGFVNTINTLAEENDELRQVLDRAGVTTLDLAKAAMAGGDAWERMQARLHDTAMSMDGGFIVATKLDKAIGDLAERAEDAAKKNDQLARVQGEATVAAEEQAEAQDQVAAATGRTSDAIALQDRFISDVNETYKQQQAELERAEQAQQDAEAAADAYRSSLEEQKRAIDDLNNANLAMLGSDIAVRDAQRRAREEMAEFTEVAKTAKVGTDEYQAAADEATLSLLAQASAATEYRTKQAEANGETVTAADKAKIMQEELGNIAAWLGPGNPLFAGLQAYIDQLNNIPRNVSTTLTIQGRTISVGGGGGNVGGTGGYGTRHTGGRVDPGTPYQPLSGEVFVPDVAGRVVSREDTRRGMGAPAGLVQERHLHLHMGGQLDQRAVGELHKMLDDWERGQL